VSLKDVQELQRMIEELQRQIQQLEHRVAELENHAKKSVRDLRSQGLHVRRPRM
jgi:prefoldin subunit 5